MADAAREIDPLARALGNLEARVEGIEKRLDRVERALRRLTWMVGVTLAVNVTILVKLLV